MDKEEIRQVAREAVHETFVHLGVDTNDVDDLREFTADLNYIRRARRGSEEVTRWTKRALLGIGLSGAVWAFWEGVKHSLGRGGQ